MPRKLNMKSGVLNVSTFTARRERSVIDYIALAVATCGGVGYIPFVAATWGSLFGVGIYLLAQKLGESLTIWVQERQFANALFESSQTSLISISLIILFFAGLCAATRVEKLTGQKDPKIVVIDEVVGQLITFLLVPAKLGWWTVLTGFLAFRLFDIWKLYPANKLEALPTGLGAMADDVVAGIYAAVLMSLLCTVYLTAF